VQYRRYGQAHRLGDGAEVLSERGALSGDEVDALIARRRIWKTVKRPSAANPGGVIVEGIYRVVGGTVQLLDLRGQLVGTEFVKPGEDPEPAARKILRGKKVSAFYSPIAYPKRSMHALTFAYRTQSGDRLKAFECQLARIRTIELGRRQDIYRVLLLREISQDRILHLRMACRCDGQHDAEGRNSD